jgi:hypothetical protein
MQGLRDYGVPDEKFWPFKIRNVNKKPAGFAPWTRANPRKGGAYESIVGIGLGRLKAIRDAIAKGYPVVFGTAVAKSFMPARGPIEIDRPKSNETLVGNHAMCIVGYEGDRFRVLNSWGKNWRDNGFCWMTQSYLIWSRSHDFTIVKGWNRIRRDN